LYEFDKKQKGESIMPGIGVNASVLRSRSQEIKNDSGELGDLIARITNRVNGLESDWQGQAAQSFVQQWADLKPSFNKAQEVLNQIGVQLDQAAAAFEEFDIEMAGKFGR
jgi:WXG100 family type VII secretion target